MTATAIATPTIAAAEGTVAAVAAGPAAKPPMFVPAEVETMDYKDVDRLRRLVSDRGRIEPRRKTGLTAKDQRKLTRAIKRARHLALLPYTAVHLRSTAEFRQASRAARYDAPRPPATPEDADAPSPETPAAEQTAAAPPPQAATTTLAAEAAAPETPAASEAPAVDSPADDASAADAPADDASAADAPADDAPADDAPADDAPADDAPADDAPADDAPR